MQLSWNALSPAGAGIEVCNEAYPVSQKSWTKSWAVHYRNKLYCVVGWMLDGCSVAGESGNRANSAKLDLELG